MLRGITLKAVVTDCSVAVDLSIALYSDGWICRGKWAIFLRAWIYKEDPELKWGLAVGGLFLLKGMISIFSNTRWIVQMPLAQNHRRRFKLISFLDDFQ